MLVKINKETNNQAKTKWSGDSEQKMKNEIHTKIISYKVNKTNRVKQRPTSVDDMKQVKQ